MRAHVLCTNCKSTPLTSTQSINISINPSQFIQFISSCSVTWARLTAMERSAVAVLHHLGVHTDLIVLLLQRDERTIKSWIERFEVSYGVEDMSRKGRDSVLTDDQAADVVRLADAHPFMVPRDIKHCLELEVSFRTIRRVLDAAGLFARIARTDFNFTPAQIEKRLAFARDHAHWAENKWARVLFADEAWVHVGQNGKIWVQRPVNTAQDPKYMKVVADTKLKIGVWLGFSSVGTMPIQVYSGTMNMARLQSIFQSNLLPRVRSFTGTEPVYLMQDNVKYHIGGEISAWYEQVGITQLEMPPYSPDLNPSENLINVLKQKVEARNPQNVESLTKMIQEEWATVKPSLCRHLSASMINRLQCVLACDGHRTGY